MRSSRSRLSALGFGGWCGCRRLPISNGKSASVRRPACQHHLAASRPSRGSEPTRAIGPLVGDDVARTAPPARNQGAFHKRKVVWCTPVAGRAVGQHPYMESICCRLQRTTSAKNGAHAAQSCQLIESGGLGVGSIEIHPVPMAVHASNGVWTPVGLRGLPSWLAGGR